MAKGSMAGKMPENGASFGGKMVDSSGERPKSFGAKPSKASRLREQKKASFK